MTTGYARVTVSGVWHRWEPLDLYYLAAACSKQSLLPRHGAKLKQKSEMTPEQIAAICRNCAAKEEAR